MGMILYKVWFSVNNSTRCGVDVKLRLPWERQASRPFKTPTTRCLKKFRQMVNNSSSSTYLHRRIL